MATPETEERLLGVGRAGTTEHVARIVRGWRRVDRQAEAREEALQHASRSLHVYPDSDGTVRIKGRLTAEAGALLVQALAAAREALYQQARTGHGRRPGTFRWTRRRWSSSRRTPSPCSRRRPSTRASTPATPASATRSWSTSMPRSWRTPTRPASRPSRTARAFQLERPSAWPATRAGW